MNRAKPFAALLAVLLPVPALAQAWQCRVPPQVSVPAMPRPDGPVSRVPVAGYTLALSWSPEFCRTRQRDPAHATQCSGEAGRFGFILHGLWPEGQYGPPQWCPARRAPDAQTVRRNLCMTPSPGLMVHEWAKHGACMTADPGAYFTAGRSLYESLEFPDMARLSRRPDLTAGALRDAMIAMNPALSRRMIRLKLSDRGWVQEVQLCYGRSFMPRACPAGRGGPADDVPVKIWRGI